MTVTSSKTRRAVPMALASAALAVMGSLALSIPVQANTELVQDPQLRQCISLAMTGVASVDLISLEELQTFNQSNQMLDCSGMGIRLINGIENLTNLTNLYLDNNQIEDIAPLEALVNLRELDLSSNQIGDIDALAGLVELGTLDLSNNVVENIDALDDLVKLTELNLVNNSVADILPLERLTRLVLLALNSNEISDVSPLANLANIYMLGLSDNQITDLSVLDGMWSLPGFFSGNVNSQSASGPTIRVGEEFDLTDWITPLTAFPLTFAVIQGSEGFVDLTGGSVVKATGTGLASVAWSDFHPCPNTEPNCGGIPSSDFSGELTFWVVEAGSPVPHVGLSTATLVPGNSPKTNGPARMADGTDAFTVDIMVVDAAGNGIPGVRDNLLLQGTGAFDVVSLVEVDPVGSPGLYRAKLASDVAGWNYELSVFYAAYGLIDQIPLQFIAGELSFAQLSAGDTQTVTGYGFTPGEWVTISIHSGSVIQPSATTARADGMVVVGIPLPANFAAGAHTAVLSANSGTVTLPFTVKGGATTPSNLPNTGASQLTLLIGFAAAVALIAGGMMLFSRDRLRRIA